ncbi:hypothetical protein Mgra_00001777 [Meloidogyne graminicola]|uniref:Uncharacterized protein n=1 Tax=Meloidogyne graminicola TaxID=189291 RepID=A0A8S9ZZW2_9BILA|nr:hypothetical protein Mgra_00001777 [Meloidogyne graminicola]
MNNNTNKKTGCGLLALLPKPKGKEIKQTKLNDSLPKLGPEQIIKDNVKEEITKTENIKEIEKPIGIKLLGIDYSSDSDDNEEEIVETIQNNVDLPVDFFGLKNKSELSSSKKIRLEDDEGYNNELQIFFEDNAPGPSRAQNEELLNNNNISFSCSSVENKTGNVLHSITDQEASRLIFERELIPNGVYNSAIADQAISGLIDVSVDAALGPNVRENLLRNLNSKQMAQMTCGPLPKLPQGSAKDGKSMPERLAKRKHQITHLAQVGFKVVRGQSYGGGEVECKGNEFCYNATANSGIPLLDVAKAGCSHYRCMLARNNCINTELGGVPVSFCCCNNKDLCNAGER